MQAMKKQVLLLTLLCAKILLEDDDVYTNKRIETRSPNIATVSTSDMPMIATRITSLSTAGCLSIALRALQLISPCPMPTDIELRAIEVAMAP